MPTSPPYTAVLSGEKAPFRSPTGLFVSSEGVPPPTPEADTDSYSDVFNPFAKPSLHHPTPASHASQPASYDPSTQAPREPSPLYAYPSSYEHTLLPSGLRLASPFGSPPSSPGWLATHEREQEEEADDEESVGSISPGAADSGKAMREAHCQVFAKTTTAFDPFAADEYIPRSGSPTAVGSKEETGETHVVSDSARRIEGEVKEESVDGQRDGRFFSGSSRYLLVSACGLTMEEYHRLNLGCIDRWLGC